MKNAVFIFSVDEIQNSLSYKTGYKKRYGCPRTEVLRMGARELAVQPLVHDFLQGRVHTPGVLRRKLRHWLSSVGESALVYVEDGSLEGEFLLGPELLQFFPYEPRHAYDVRHRRVDVFDELHAQI